MKLLLWVSVFTCALAPAQDIKSGYVRGTAVHYKVVDGVAVTEGDILLDPESSKTPVKEAIGISTDRFRWPDGIVPYSIDVAIPDQQRITGAVQHWNDNTRLRLIPRTDQADYVRFVRKPSGCSSFVGMIGGAQSINLGDDCSLGNTIHEIGHAIGLYHEQSRQDRDFYMQVIYANLDKREFLQYDQKLSGADDLGGYDFGSIMHYSPSGFSRNGELSLQSIPMGIPIGQRAGLSPGDLDAVKRLYGQPNTQTIIATFPEGLNIVVDGEIFPSPKTFQWTPGTTHALNVPATQSDGVTRNEFARWSDDGDQSHSITVTAAITVYTANFVQYIKVLGAPNPSLGGSLQYSPPSADGFYPYGTEVEVTAVPNPGYSFLSWSGFGLFSVHGVGPNPLRFAVTDSRTRYDASFTRSVLTKVTSNPPALNVMVDGKSIITPQNFAWTPGSTHTLRVETDTQLSQSGTQQYVYQNWSDGGDVTHTVTATAEAATVTAAFKTQYQVLVNTSPITGGTLQMDPFSETGYYDAGAELRILPLASGSFKFVNWSGDLSGATAPGILTLDDQKIITANFAAPKQLTANSIVSAANFLLNGGVCPGEIVTIFGLEFGPVALVGSRINPGTRNLDTVLADTRVLFDGIAAPLIYVSPNQISAVVPYSVAGKATTRITVNYNGQNTNGLLMPVVEAVPSLFTFDSSGKGPAAMLNQDGSVNTRANPAQRGSTVVLYATGEGQTAPAGVDGKPAVVPLPKPVLPVKALVASREAIVLYAGAAPGLTAGLLQVNVRIPVDAPTGAVPVSLVVGNKSSPANVTIWVQ